MYACRWRVPFASLNAVSSAFKLGMWGGVKGRTHHGDIFRAWNANQGLEILRHKLYREPRPWYLAWSLHHHKHLLGDYHCARLLSWCTTVMSLEKRPSSKREAYMYAQQVFQFMVHSHKVGTETYQEFFRLCAAGRDLTTAFRWQQYLVETNQAFPLSHYTWLLHIAILSPNDENAEDMAEAVWETYLARYCHVVKHEISGDSAISHYQPSNEKEAKELDGLFKAFRQLRPKIAHNAKPELLKFIDSLPDASQSDAPQFTWPTRSRHHVFRQLEAGSVLIPPPSLSQPRLRDSILHENFISDLEKAAFAKDVKRVMLLVNEYLDRISAEKNRKSGEKYRMGERDIWHQFSDPSAAAFRAGLVESGGVTAELYHYLIVAIAASQPSLALRTLRRMEDSNLRVLDLTRAVMIVNCEGSNADQQALLQEQIREVELREKIDQDYDVTREVELFWKFCYTDFFHYRNALSRMDLYKIIIEGLGPVRVQELLLETKHRNAGDNSDDVVVLDKDFRKAVVTHYRSLLGEENVNRALDDITGKFPKLDVSVLGSLPHFSDYALPDDDFVATDISALREKLVGYSKIYILDSSFIETSEHFLTLGNCSGNDESKISSLILIPYCSLQQIASTIEGAEEEENTVVTFDESLQEANKIEPFLASQRLRSLFALLRDKNKNKKTRVLHFSECLMAHSVEASMTTSVGLNPAESDNDHLFLLLAMIRAIASAGSEVILCTDDASLIKLFHEKKFHSFFVRDVQIMSSEPPQEVMKNEENVIDDNPNLCLSMDFEPVLQSSIREKKINKIVSDGNKDTLSLKTDIPEVSAEIMGTAWLDMLEEEEKAKEDQTNNSIEAYKHVASSKVNSGDSEGVILMETEEDGAKKIDEDAEEHERLMNMYDSEHAVVPVGALMAEASSLGSVFEQFDAIEPDAEREHSMTAPSRQQTTPGEAQGKTRRRTHLEREALRNRGASNKQRYRLGRRLSNMAGGRVPFNFRYRVLEVNAADPRNKSFVDAYKEGVSKKRESFKRNFNKSYLVGGVSP